MFIFRMHIHKILLAKYNSKMSTKSIKSIKSIKSSIKYIEHRHALKNSDCDYSNLFRRCNLLLSMTYK